MNSLPKVLADLYGKTRIRRPEEWTRSARPRYQKPQPDHVALLTARTAATNVPRHVLQAGLVHIPAAGAEPLESAAKIRPWRVVRSRNRARRSLRIWRCFRGLSGEN